MFCSGPLGIGASVYELVPTSRQLRDQAFVRFPFSMQV